jgi:hypothetical protein
VVAKERNVKNFKSLSMSIIMFISKKNVNYHGNIIEVKIFVHSCGMLDIRTVLFMYFQNTL